MDMLLTPDNDTRRGAGILLPIYSLPSPYGIGNIGPSAFAFIDFLADSGQKYWQILPLGPTSSVFGNSPYMSYSSLAGNPLFISPELLVGNALLKQTEIAADGFSEYLVEYPQVTKYNTRLLLLAWQKFSSLNADAELEKFKRKNPWACDYALFLSLKKRYRQRPWYAWPKEIRLRKNQATLQAKAELADEINYHTFVQYLFFTQWDALHRYARKQGIRIVGDLPIYVALDSVDVWVHQEIFELQATNGRPKSVAGVPPDYFSSTGQLWGNPLYRWHARSTTVKKHLYDWWQHRLEAAFTMADVIRIDHFRGFSSYWSVPAHEKTAIHGKWKQGPGISFFREMENRLGSMEIIAEDLGIITPEVEQLRDELGYPGMKILLFAFDGNANNSYLPQNYSHNCVVYTGTHDNDTAVGWYLSPTTTAEMRRRAKRQANQKNDDAASFHRDLIYLAHSSVADVAIIPMQDILGFGNDCRMNTPGTIKGNWRWRCADRFITDELAEWLRDVTVFFNRLNKKTPIYDEPDSTSGI